MHWIVSANRVVIKLWSVGENIRRTYMLHVKHMEHISNTLLYLQVSWRKYMAWTTTCVKCIKLDFSWFFKGMLVNIMPWSCVEKTASYKHSLEGPGGFSLLNPIYTRGPSSRTACCCSRWLLWSTTSRCLLPAARSRHSVILRQVEDDAYFLPVYLGVTVSLMTFCWFHPFCWTKCEAFSTSCAT